MRSLFFLAIGAAAAAQQPPAPGEDQPITVIGEREESEEQARRNATRFVDSHAVTTRIGQYARWHDPICVRAGGLEPEMNARIANRVMDIAESVGVPTNRAQLCAPNIRIVFTGDPQAMIAMAARRNPQVIGFHYASQRGRVMRVRQPVQAWYATTTAGVLDQAGVRAPGGAAGSRLSNGIASGLAHVLILADIRIVEGEEVDSIAELLAFLALAQTPVAETCDAAETILNLMNPACPPARRPLALTRYDFAYLRALYSVDPTWGPALQRGSVVLRMRDVLQQGR